MHYVQCLTHFTVKIVTGDGSLTGRKAIDDGKVEPGFLCSSGTILDLVQLCDGTADCESGDDETHPLCASKRTAWGTSVVLSIIIDHVCM